MANPQREDGHIDIANEIAEKLARTQLSGTEHRIIWAIWRKTWGWHKKEDRISLSQLVKMTEMSRRSVRRTLEGLVNKNIIIKNFGRDETAPSSINFLRFNKDYETWKAGDKTVHRDETAPKSGDETAPHKRKERKGLKILKKEYFDLVDLLIERMRLNDPRARVLNTERQREEWANDFKRLIERDGRSMEEVREVLIWCQEDSFWRGNILSASKLRKQFTQLKLKKEAMHKPEKPDPAELTRKEMKQ
jgi:phage replication O-like protein O